MYPGDNLQAWSENAHRPPVNWRLLEAAAFIFPRLVKNEENLWVFDLDKAAVATGTSCLFSILHLCSGGQANLPNPN